MILQTNLHYLRFFLSRFQTLSPLCGLTDKNEGLADFI